MRDILLQLREILDELPEHVITVRHILRRFGKSLDTAYLERQIDLLAQEVGLPDLMEWWSSVRGGGSSG